MKVKTNTLIGPALDWAVCLANGYDEGWLRRQLTNPNPSTRAIPKPSTDHAQGGPIIERERISLHDGGNYNRSINREYCWRAMGNAPNAYWGATMLIAAMRCYVASRLGDEIDVPEELL